MKTQFFYSLLAIGFLAISCAKECDEPDIQRINSLYFELKQGGSDGFDEDEIDELYFVRYVPNSEPLIADTFYTGGVFPEGGTKFLINDEYPFRNNEAPYYVVYGYEIVVESDGYATIIEEIELGGEYDGDCGYTNTKKAFKLNGEDFDQAGSQEFVLITK